MNKKQTKLDNILIAIGATGLIACLLGGVFAIYNRMMSIWQNAIGALYLEEEAEAGNYIYALFEDISQENIDASKKAFASFGYTQKGLYYSISSAGIIKICVAMMIVAGIMVAVIVYAMYRKKSKAAVEKQQLLSRIAKLEELKQWDEYLEKHNKRIQNFIENISHQIKTPVSRVYSSLYLIEEDLEDEVKKDRIKECYAHLESVDGLMKRLMDIGRLEAGKIIFEKSRIDFKELLKDAVRSCTTMLGDEEKVSISFEMDEKVEYYGDYQWLREGFINIINNAMEHDKSGRALEIHCGSESDNIKITIRDHGTGISEKDIPNIFDRFYMPEETKSTHTGIGLNLAKLIFEGHMGGVYV